MPSPLFKDFMISLFKVFMPDVSKQLNDVLQSGYIGQGPKVEEFELKLEKYIGKNATVNSCTSALQLAYELIDIRGKTVISTPATCTATNIAILNAGGNIVWADVDKITGNISVDSVRSLITKEIAAITCVHYGGTLCSNELLDFEIPLVEDCAHRFNESLGGYQCYSFQAIKFLTTIDGGALVCPNDVDHRRAKLMRWFGIDRDAGQDMRCMNPIYEKGYKFHMNDVNATIGIEQLKHIKSNIDKHRCNAKRYCDAFGIPYEYGSDYWLYVMHVNDRDKFIIYMKDNGIEASTVHGRNDVHPIFRDSRKDLPCVDKFYETQVAIPVGWWLTDDNIDYIIEKVSAWLSSH